MSVMRLFIAINFTDETKGQLLALRDELRSTCERGRFSAPENMHLTLAFLGECDAVQTASIQAIMGAVEIKPFSISIERVGRFRSGNRKQRVPAQSTADGRTATEQVSNATTSGNGQSKSVSTWWAGVQSSKPLLELQQGLSEKLFDAGFALDKRRYNPHITLGREVVTDTAPWQIQPFGETVKSIELMLSERIDGKLAYAAIFTKENNNK